MKAHASPSGAISQFLDSRRFSFDPHSGYLEKHLGFGREQAETINQLKFEIIKRGAVFAISDALIEYQPGMDVGDIVVRNKSACVKVNLTD